MARTKKTKGKGNKQPGIKRAKWNSSCDAMLLECLEKEKANGHMTSNSSWHNNAWTTAEKSLAGTELHYGGGPKTANSCSYRWTSVCAFVSEIVVIDSKNSLAWLHSLRRTMF